MSIQPAMSANSGARSAPAPMPGLARAQALHFFDIDCFNRINHTFGVAEAGETPEQARFLAAAGCDRFQGDYLSRPLAPARFAALLADAGRAPAAEGAL